MMDYLELKLRINIKKIFKYNVIINIITILWYTCIKITIDNIFKKIDEYQFKICYWLIYLKY